MGVKLEGAQNKFAGIIGELISEPLLLSQFVIWVDLCVSEYKLKGTFSLDCSGDNPDYSWLKGHEKPLAKRSFQQTGNGQTRPAGKVPGPRLGPKMGPRSVWRPEPVKNEDTSSMEPVDPDVAVMEGPLDHASPGPFPVRLTQSNQNRKRPAEETLSKSVDMSDVSPAKTDRTEAGSKLKKDVESIAYSSRYSSSALHLAPHFPSSADDSSSAHHMTSFQSFDSFNLDQAPTHQQAKLTATKHVGGA